MILQSRAFLIRPGSCPPEEALLLSLTGLQVGWFCHACIRLNETSRAGRYFIVQFKLRKYNSYILIQ